jgi:NADPH-dependent FMN reductase
MEHYVGLDVSLKLTSICVVNQTGSVVREGVVDSDPEAIAAFVRSNALVRIGLETGPTATWLWTELKRLDVTPEHDRSIPALLKNAVDWGGPYGKNSWTGKPGFITGTSPGAIGSALAQQHLRSVMVGLGMTLLGGEAYVTFKPDLVDDDGNIGDRARGNFCKGFSTSSLRWSCDSRRRTHVRLRDVLGEKTREFMARPR